MKKLVSLLLCLSLCVLVLSGCGAKNADALWQSAKYTADTELGEGSKTVNFTVTANDKSVCFTVRTDKDMVGEALQDVGLVEGEEGAYGLYVKVVNGMTADYDKDQAYWSFTIDGEASMTGCDMTEINEGIAYGFEYAK